MTEKIIDKCPSCGSKTLFIGSGGYLTCSLIDCSEPSTGRAIAILLRVAKAADAFMEADWSFSDESAIRGIEGCVELNQRIDEARKAGLI